MKRKIIVILILIGVISLASYRVYESIKKREDVRKESKKESEFSYVVSVKKAVSERIKDSINFVGEVKGINEVTVVPKVVGRLIKKIKEEGNFVNKDEAICEVDRDEPVLRFSVYELKSPISGILAKYFVDVGGVVSPQTPICIVSDTSKVKIIFNIDEKLVSKVNKYSYVSVETETGKKFVSNKIQLSNYIDPMSRTMEVRVILDNQEGYLRSGAFVKGEVVFYEKISLVIPSDAIYDIDGKKILFVIKEGNLVEEREIETGLRYKNLIEVVSGVKEGEKVVYKGGELLTDGMKVEIIE
ncbi:MAG: efflux RND transporter periplasmic adaptor subunit [Endomicrobia bacterium]|nr:efflux RND transporter periplasmic adaptor subunit [Endomicrobiia bacterium]